MLEQTENHSQFLLLYIRWSRTFTPAPSPTKKYRLRTAVAPQHWLPLPHLVTTGLLHLATTTTLSPLDYHIITLPSLHHFL